MDSGEKLCCSLKSSQLSGLHVWTDSFPRLLERLPAIWSDLGLFGFAQPMVDIPPIDINEGVRKNLLVRYREAT